MIDPIKPLIHPSLVSLVESEAKDRKVPPAKHHKEIILSTYAPENFDYRVSGGRFEVKFARNSPLNGKTYLDEQGQEKTLQGCSSSSGDRTNEHVLSMRGIYKDGKLVCATGRPDTMLRGVEQSQFIPFGETFVIQSLMSPLGFFNQTAFNEKQSTLNESHVTEKLPHKPFLFVRPINLFSLLENILPKRFSGRLLADRISKDTQIQFKQYFYSLRIPFSIDEQKCIDDCFYFLEHEDLLPEEELLLRDLLCKFAGLPIVYHCKSSTDRTTVATNISCILAGWKHPFPRVSGRFAPHHIIKDPRFKAEFAEHSQANLPVTLLSRGVQGWSWGKGLLTNPTAARLLPNEYTRPIKKAPRLVLAFFLYIFSLPLNILSLPFSSNKGKVLNKIFNPYSAWKALPDREISPDSGLLKSIP